MARILVETPDTVTARRVDAALRERLMADGHQLADDASSCDALLIVFDPATPRVIATAAAAAARGQPVLALCGHDSVELPDGVQAAPGVDEADWFGALPGWYETIRPYAGRVVRDLIPRLVREAGHELTFRAADERERPRLLKQKILAEAKELSEATAGAEVEEIADLLEALETLIRTRGYDRSALKHMKESKRKQRGGFERCFVVEETTAPAEPAAVGADIVEA